MSFNSSSNSDDSSYEVQKSDDDDSDDLEEGKRKVPVLQEFNDYITKLYEQGNSNNTSTRVSGKLTVEGINESNKKICRGGPDATVQVKKEQLELHNRLHDLYTYGKLWPYLLSFYLHESTPYRSNLLKYFANPEDAILLTDFATSICPSRLAKFPTGWIILADRGFSKDAYLYPNMNRHITPTFLAHQSQFTSGEISRDRVICEHRYTCEVVFSRFNDVMCLRDVVPYQFNNIMTDAVHWGFAHNNLQQPLKNPAGYVEYLKNINA